MTVEEIAKKYIYNGWWKMNVGGWKARMEEAFLAGYNEAMRWRDLREEKPQFIKGKDLTLLIKDDNCIWLGDFMDEAHFNFNTKNRGIIFWRPIE